MQIHQMDFVGGLHQRIFSRFRNREIVVRIGIQIVAVIGFNIGFFHRIGLIQPFSGEIRFFTQPGSVECHQRRVHRRLCPRIFIIDCLDHPAENMGIRKRIRQRVVTVFDMHRQLTGPLLTARQFMVDDILLHNPDFIRADLRDHRHMTGALKFAPFLPDK